MTMTIEEAERVAKDYTDGEGFGYGFVENDDFTGTIKYYLRPDRVFFDWMFEPIPEEEFINGIAKVKLPEGYFFKRGLLFQIQGLRKDSPWEIIQEKAETHVEISQENPVHGKARIAIREFWCVDPLVFEAARLPVDKIFYVER